MATVMATVKGLEKQERPQNIMMLDWVKAPNMMSKILKITVLFIYLAQYSAYTFSGEWKTSYGVGVKELYTSNVCLDADNEEGEWITTATPTVRVSGSGARATLDLSASMEVNNLDSDNRQCNNSDSGADNYNPKLSGNARLELLPNLLNVDITGAVEQNKVDPFLSSGDSTLNKNSNTNTSYSYSVSPNISHRFKDLSVVNFRYTYDNQTNSEDEVDDSELHAASLSIASAGISKLSWSLLSNYREVNYDQDEQSESDDYISSVNFSLGYQIHRKWRLNASTGQDINDFESSNNDVDGNRWSASINWTPNPRTDVTVGTGNRFIGDTPTLNINYRHKHSSLSLNYEKLVTFSRSLRTQDVFFSLIDANGDPVLDIDGRLALIRLNQTTLTRSPIVDERLNLAYQWSGGRTSLSLNASESKQTREEDNFASTFTTTSMGLRRRLSPKLSISGGVTYSKTEIEEGSEALGQDSELYRWSLGLEKKLGLHTSMNINYILTDRKSDDHDDEYSENRTSIGVKMNW
jgi:uncharacterized protein (PEP-CTERM system associated)